MTKQIIKPKNTNKNLDNDSDKQFPWYCHLCNKYEIIPQITNLDYNTQHKGKRYSFTVYDINIPTCQKCGYKVFTDEVENQMDVTFNKHVKQSNKKKE